MAQFPSNSYVFDDFIFDAEKHALYHRNQLVKNTEKKSLQVLAVLLQNANQMTSHDEIIKQVWKDNPLGVTSGHIGQYISKLRKVFAEFDTEKNYIETVKGRGYSFIGDVSSNASETSINSKEKQIEFSPALPETEQEGEKTFSLFGFQKFTLVFLVMIPIFLLTLFGWTWLSENNEEEIKRVVKESQLYESLVIYKNPKSFNEASLDKYWTAELEINSNYDRQRIREAVQKMNAESRQYGDGTKCEQFEFQSIEINQDKNLAVVKTLEKWFIAVYFDDGTLQKNKTVGPYFVSYILRRVDGNWLIEKSNTARVNRPTPRLSEIKAVSEAQSNRQFLVKITGQEFEPETVFIEVFGVGCPENKPCKVPNSALREHSTLSDTRLENVPLTLASGDFRIVVRNGDSQASNALQINVP